MSASVPSWAPIAPPLTGASSTATPWGLHSAAISAGVSASTVEWMITTVPADGQGSEGSLSEIDLMLAEYYAERGWVNGVVPESKLKELEIL